MVAICSNLDASHATCYQLHIPLLFSAGRQDSFTARAAGVAGRSDHTLLKHDKQQGGWIGSTELIVLMTCALCAVVICCAAFGSKAMGEWSDAGAAIGSLNQSYSLTGLEVGHPIDPVHPTPVALWSGSSYVDTVDYCDVGGCGIQVCVAPAPESKPPVPPISCREIEKLKANCLPGGNLTAQVVLVDTSHSGETVTITLDGTPHVLTIVDDEANFFQAGTPGGPHKINLADPSGCVDVDPQFVFCPQQ